ncbi:GNAT family N-acetyltransferase [Halolamina rubra]|uniref:GNAT family N-acetyltransferase n=1 Tax=Halolamina rubra TaxID=1380430 RepID=UPI00067846B8|nr:GNAT family N-acetyltransferase [Halolamina rubra]
MEIRPLREAEAAAFVEALWLPYAESLADHDPYGGLVDEPVADATEHRRERVRGDDTFDRVAVVDDELVGYVAGDHRPAPPVVRHGDTAHVNELFVRPAYRRQGIADALLADAEAWAEQRDCVYVTLHVHRENESARALYEQRGYDVTRHELRKPLD